MAVQEQTPYIEHIANGVTTSFTLGFVCDSADNLVVTINDIPTNVGDWSFSNEDVVFQYPQLSGSIIKIWRNSPLARSTTFKTYDNSLNPNSLNLDLDKIWLVMQELNVKNFISDNKLQELLDKLVEGDINGLPAEILARIDADERLQTAINAEEVRAYAAENARYTKTETYNKTEVDSALSQKAPQATTYTKAEVDTVFAAYVGGRKAYTTLALAQAAQSSLPANTAIEVTNDPTASNNGTYQWNGTTLTKSASYSDLNKVDKTDIWYSYSDGNLIGSKTKQYVGKGILGNWAIGTDARYNSKVIRADIAKELYILNSVQDYDRYNGNGVAFFDANPMTGAANRITDTRTTYIDTVSGLTYLKVSVPAGAKYLAFNTKFNAVNIDWAIHTDGFSNNYNAGTEYASGVLDSPFLSSQSVQIESEISSGTTVIGDIYDSSKLLLNAYLNTQGTLGASSSAQAWKVFPFAVDEDVTYFVKITSALTYPFKVVYSKSLTAVSTTAGTFVSNVTLQLTEIENVYKFTVPTGLGIKAVFMNVELVTGTTPTIDLRDTLSIQKHCFDVAKIGVRKSAIDSLLDNVLVDDEARKLAAQAIQFQSSGSRLKDAKVLALGDSITEGTRGGYVKYLEAAFDTTVMNRGSSGGRASRVVDIVTAGEGLPKRDSGTANIVWTPIDYTNLKCVTLMIGTNDSDNATFGDITDLPAASIQDYATLADYAALFPNNYVSNIALAIEYIKWKAPDAEIHLITPPYLYNTTAGGTTRITKLIPHLEAVAKHYAVHLIYATYESGLSFKLMRGDLDIYSYDGTHFNERGNEVFGKFVAQKVLSFG